MTVIKKITKDNASDLNLKNEPFTMPGRFIPSLQDGAWNYRTEPFPEPQTMVFPDEKYDYDEVAGKGAVFGAYEDGKCIGIAITNQTVSRGKGSAGIGKTCHRGFSF